MLDNKLDLDISIGVLKEVYKDNERQLNNIKEEISDCGEDLELGKDLNYCKRVKTSLKTVIRHMMTEAEYREWRKRK